MTIRRGWLILLIALAPAGCGQESGGPSDGPGESVQKEAIATPPTPVEKETSPRRRPGPERLRQSFLEATRKQPPADSRPAETTLTGKSVARLYEEVLRLWDTIDFAKEDGSRLHYSATVETALGTIEIDLDPERAPNHVRNFIALARMGYYDGLVFDRIQHNETNLETAGRFEEIEAGCPIGKGDPTKNSLGYWLKPEISADSKHEEGAVGACRMEEKDTAGCKFYITLGKAPYLDGHFTVFGKVTKGLDVARKIFLQPVVLEDRDLDGGRRPLDPVTIRKVVVHTRGQ